MRISAGNEGMRIQILSDIHLEFRSHKDKPLIQPDVDYIVFAGDIVTSPRDAERYFKETRELTSAKFIYVLGNHEFYGKVYPSIIDDYMKIPDSVESLYVLEKTSLLFKEHNVRFVGTTGWTSYRDGQDQTTSQEYMNDFRSIKTFDHEGHRYITTRDIRKEHNICKLFLEGNLSKTEDETVIMVTHHGVSPSSISTRYIASRINGAFYEDLRELIHRTKPKMCIHGHTHHACSYKIGETLVVCNPMGYLFERNNGFMEALTLRIDKDGITMEEGLK